MARPQAEPALSESSLAWLAGSDPLSRKRHGQYLTPRSVADALVSRVDAKPGLRVLDPGVGTGEILTAVARRFPDADLTGWDIDETALEAAREMLPGATLELRSALELPAAKEASARSATDSAPEGVPESATAEERFDLVIGNPPYFQVPVTAGLKERFGGVISGRANVFALFFQVGLELLDPGGTLAFVVPPSMNSGAYFEALREYIVAGGAITDLTALEGSTIFEGANTAAQLLVIRKDGDSSDFVFEHSEPEAGFRRVVFTQSPEDLRGGFEGRRTLWQAGFEAVTGTVVWNQRRSDLRREPGPGSVPLVWSRDLRGGTFEPGYREDRSDRREAGARDEKPGYIRSERRLTGPALLVNRVVGAVGRGELRTCLVPAGTEFLAENHVNVIRERAAVRDAGPGDPPAARLGWERLQAAVEALGTGDRARLLTGNTQLSATELTHLLPI